MPFIPVLPPENASPAAAAVYDEFYRRMSFPAPPNFIMTQGHSPTTARGTWELVQNVLVLGQIPRWKKEMIFAAISKDRNCRYCEAAHIACCRMLGVDPKMLNALVRNVDGIADTNLREMIQFCRKCARDPQSLTAEDYARLEAQGFKMSEVVELVGMSALAVYATMIADATGMEPDQMFSEL